MTSDRADELLAGWRARLDEDEAAARGCPNAEWKAGPVVPAGRFLVGCVTEFSGHLLARGLGYHDPEFASVVHAARHDPARALREAPMKRLVLEEHLPIESIYGLACKRCVSWQDAPLADGGETEFGIGIPDPWPCVPVRSVAASWDA